MMESYKEWPRTKRKMMIGAGADAWFHRGGDQRYNDGSLGFTADRIARTIGKEGRQWVSNFENGKINISLYDYLQIMDTLCSGKTEDHPALALRKYLLTVAPLLLPNERIAKDMED